MTNLPVKGDLCFFNLEFINELGIKRSMNFIYFFFRIDDKLRWMGHSKNYFDIIPKNIFKHFPFGDYLQ